MKYLIILLTLLSISLLASPPGNWRSGANSYKRSIKYNDF